MNLSVQVQNLLMLLKNSKTKVDVNSEVKKEEYSFLTNTIYISLNERRVEKGLESANPFCLKLIAMYKTYFESKQAKLLHILKLIFNYLNLIMFAMVILFRIVFGKSIGVCVLAAFFVILSLWLNMFLENNAYKRACVYIKKNIEKIADLDISKENVTKLQNLVKKNKFKLIINKERYRLIMLIFLLMLMI